MTQNAKTLLNEPPFQDQFRECRGGLNDFLTTFGLAEFEPRVRVYYTLTGSYEVEGDDIDAAYRDAQAYLRPDLSELDNVIDDSDAHTTTVDRIEDLDS